MSIVVKSSVRNSSPGCMGVGPAAIAGALPATAMPTMAASIKQLLVLGRIAILAFILLRIVTVFRGPIAGPAAVAASCWQPSSRQVRNETVLLSCVAPSSAAVDFPLDRSRAESPATTLPQGRCIVIPGYDAVDWDQLEQDFRASSSRKGAGTVLLSAAPPDQLPIRLFLILLDPISVRPHRGLPIAAQGQTAVLPSAPISRSLLGAVQSRPHRLVD